MDGYLRVETDSGGKIIEIWDEWYKDRDLSLYMGSCGGDKHKNVILQRTN